MDDVGGMNAPIVTTRRGLPILKSHYAGSVRRGSHRLLFDNVGGSIVPIPASYDPKLKKKGVIEIKLPRYQDIRCSEGQALCVDIAGER